MAPADPAGAGSPPVIVRNWTGSASLRARRRPSRRSAALPRTPAMARVCASWRQAVAGPRCRALRACCAPSRTAAIRHFSALGPARRARQRAQRWRPVVSANASAPGIPPEAWGGGADALLVASSQSLRLLLADMLKGTLPGAAYRREPRSCHEVPAVAPSMVARDREGAGARRVDGETLVSRRPPNIICLHDQSMLRAFREPHCAT